MAERLLSARLRELMGAVADELVCSRGAGTGDWHVGQGMDPNASWQIRQHDGDPSGFTARELDAQLIEASDLILAATHEHAEFILTLDPAAAERVFLLREFARLILTLDGDALPRFAANVGAVLERGRALVAAADAARVGASAPSADAIGDPYMHGERYFRQIADEIDESVRVIAEALVDRS